MGEGRDKPVELTAAQLLATVCNAVEPLEFVNAMWLGGSQAFGEDDEYSDIDIQVDCADGRQDEVFAAVESALGNLSPIELKWRLPEPAWHGHSQALYRLENTPEWLLIDLVVMQRSSEAPRLDEREIHGEPVVLFDKLGVIKAVHADAEAVRRQIYERVMDLRMKFDLFSHFPAKELKRGRYLDALWRYNTYVLGPLLGILRAKYSPWRFNWGPRYLQRDLPPEIYERLLGLTFVADEAELIAKVDWAVAWAREEFAAFEMNELQH